MRYDCNAERRNRDYKEAALRFREDQAELLTRISLAQTSGNFEDAQNGLVELEQRALLLFGLREHYSPKLDFIQGYQVTIADDGLVSFVLPKGVSHCEFLRHAQNIACELHGCPAVYSARLAQWEKFPSAVEYGGRLPDLSEERAVAVRLGVSASAAMTLDEQDDFLASLGSGRASVMDTVAACAAFFAITGRPAFDESLALRAKGGCVYWGKEGVGMRGVVPHAAAPWILAAADVSGRRGC
jgi:hypothetical protein